MQVKQILFFKRFPCLNRYNDVTTEVHAFFLKSEGFKGS